MNDWSPGFEVINSFLFPITSCTIPGLNLLDLPIWISFDFEGPLDWEDVFTGVWNVFPTSKFFGESLELDAHYMPELSLKRYSIGSVEQRVVLVIFGFLDMRLKHSWIRHIIEVVVVLICVPRVKN